MPLTALLFGLDCSHASVGYLIMDATYVKMEAITCPRFSTVKIRADLHMKIRAK
jgi:hypothetical protein